MNACSGIIKASICVIYTVLISIIITIPNMGKYWWISIILTIIGAIIDSYYLGLEKIYVEKYNVFLEDLNKCEVDVNKIYDMKPRNTSLKCEIIARTIESFTSFSIWGFYLMFIILSILVKYI